MKKLILFLFLFLISGWLGRPTYAQIATLAKPITGTFIFPDFFIGDQATLDSFLDEIKAVGMDTLIWTYTGGVYKSNCADSNYNEYNFFTDNRLNYLENAEKLLQAVHDKGFSVYVGLTGLGNCVDVSRGSPEDLNSDQGRVIDLSKRLANSLKQLSVNKGWGWDDNFIKGFYITQELDIHKFHTGPGAWKAYFNFYKNISTTIKSLHPSKRILLSPYQYEWYSYQTVYDNIKYAVANTAIDIFAPQDSVGVGNVTSFFKDKEHFRGLSDAVRDANKRFGKSVEAWANVETFKPTTDGTTSPPTDIKTLSWQVRAVDGFVNKKITWVYNWSLSSLPLLENNGPQYTPDYAIRRKQLRGDYLSRPIIVAAFTWYTPTNFVIKGYNFGQPGEVVDFYLHYQNLAGQNKTFQTRSTLYNINQPVVELRIPISSIPEFDQTKSFQLAVKNTAGDVGYYVSDHPESAPDPDFPEITPLPGDLNRDGKVDIFDYNLLVQNFGNTTCGNVADIDGNCKVDIFHYNVLVGNFGK